MGKTALEKMGFKAGMNGVVTNRPDSVAAAVPLATVIPVDARPDLIVSFVSSVTEVSETLDSVLPLYKKGSRLWFAYPKKSTGIKTDISRDAGWDAVVEKGLLPVTQIAIDDTWSALRFRFCDEIKKLTRKSDMPTKGSMH